MELKIVAILTEEAKKKIAEVVRQTWHGGKPNTETDLYIGQTRVVIRQGVVQSEIPAQGPVSQEIQEFLVGVKIESTLHEELLRVKREKGKYFLPSNRETTGTVEFYVKDVVRITCYGPNREQVLELHELIRSGQIHPDVSFECPTSGPTRQQLLDTLCDLRIKDAQSQERGDEFLKELFKLEAERQRLIDELGQTKAELEKSKGNNDRSLGALGRSETSLRTAEKKLEEIRSYARNLEAGLLEWVPWTSRHAVVIKINRILLDGEPMDGGL